MKAKYIPSVVHKGNVNPKDHRVGGLKYYRNFRTMKLQWIRV